MMTSYKRAQRAHTRAVQCAKCPFHPPSIGSPLTFAHCVVGSPVTAHCSQ